MFFLNSCSNITFSIFQKNSHCRIHLDLKNVEANNILGKFRKISINSSSVKKLFVEGYDVTVTGTSIKEAHIVDDESFSRYPLHVALLDSQITRIENSTVGTLRMNSWDNSIISDSRIETIPSHGIVIESCTDKILFQNVTIGKIEKYGIRIKGVCQLEFQNVTVGHATDRAIVLDQGTLLLNQGFTLHSAGSKPIHLSRNSEVLTSIPISAFNYTKYIDVTGTWITHPSDTLSAEDPHCSVQDDHLDCDLSLNLGLKVSLNLHFTFYLIHVLE